MATHVLLVGLSHRTAPIEVRERVDFTARGVADALAALSRRGSTREAVVLSTCNRAELYVVCEEVESTRRDLTAFLSEFHGVAATDLAPYLHHRVDAEAARHLVTVAGGLDSLVVGEPQIFGQVKHAFTIASECHSVGPVLTRLFHWSFAAGKRVRSETGLAEGAVSVGYAAVGLARKIFGDLAARHALIIGAGEMGKLTALHLKAQGIGRLTVTSRTPAHALALAGALQTSAIPWERLEAALATSDIVITATGSPSPILGRPQIEAAMRARRNQPLFIIDIAVPRDVDPIVGEREQVFLYNIDDLQVIVRENLSRRSAELARAEAIVAEEVTRFEAWFRSRSAIPTVVALRERFEAIRRAELQRLEPRLASLAPEARARLEDVTRLIVEKLLLTPTEQLKALGDPEAVLAYSDALNRLFDLPVDGATGAYATVPPAPTRSGRPARGDESAEMVLPSTGGGEGSS